MEKFTTVARDIRESQIWAGTITSIIIVYFPLSEIHYMHTLTCLQISFILYVIIMMSGIEETYHAINKTEYKYITKRKKLKQCHAGSGM